MVRRADACGVSLNRSWEAWQQGYVYEVSESSVPNKYIQECQRLHSTGRSTLPSMFTSCLPIHSERVGLVVHRHPPTVGYTRETLGWSAD